MPQCQAGGRAARAPALCGLLWACITSETWLFFYFFFSFLKGRDRSQNSVIFIQILELNPVKAGSEE